MSWKTRIRNLIGSVWFKIAIAALAIGLLLGFNRIDWRVLSRLGETWPWLVAAFLLMLPPFAIVSLRFQLILRSQGVRVPLGQAIRWTMIGAFFDLVMPSSNGGDLVKAGYVVKHVGPGMRTRAVMSVFFDRVLGLLGLFLLASIVSLIAWDVVSEMPARGPVLLALFGGSFGVLLGFRVLGARRLFWHPAVQKRFDRGPWGARARQLIGSFNELRERPRDMIAALALSVFNHSFWCISLLCIAMAVGNQIDWIKGFVVFPLAIFSNVFGVAGGFGVGTAGFDLFLSQLLNVGNGALIGLIFQGLSALSRLMGLPFYVLATRSDALPKIDTAAETDIRQAEV